MSLELPEGESGRKIIESDILVLDSNEFIFALTDPGSESAKLLKRIKNYVVAIPSLVAEEVNANLGALHSSLPGKFYQLLSEPEAHIIYISDDPPVRLWQKYLNLGLSEEDALIGAFAEWVKARFLISENRHFLEHLITNAFIVVNAETMLQMIDKGEVKGYI